MGDPTLAQVLAAAGISSGVNYCLMPGLSLGGGIVEMGGVPGVPILDSLDQTSRFVPLSEIVVLVEPNPVFTAPFVFRPTSLDACLMPTPENLDEILLQIVSGDDEGRAALDFARKQANAEGPEAEAELERQIEAARQRIAEERPEEAAQVERSYHKYQKTSGVRHAPILQESPTPKSGNAGTGTQGVGVKSGSTTVTTPKGVVSGGVSTKDVVSSTPDSGYAAPAVRSTDTIETPIGPPLVSTSSEPFLAASRLDDYDDASPTEFSVPVWVTPEMIGLARVGNPTFVPTLLRSVVAMSGDSSPAIVQMLTSSDPSARGIQESVRRGVSEVFWRAGNSLGISGSPMPFQPMALGFRYIPERRGIEISLAPMGRDGRSITPPMDEDDSDGFPTLPRSLGQSSLALFSPIGTGIPRVTDVFSTATVFVPLLPPSQLRLGPLTDGGPVLMARGADGDRALHRVDRRGDSPDHQGDEGQERDSRGGHSGREDHQDRQDPSGEEELTFAA